MSIEDVWAYPSPPERKYRKAADSKAQLIAAGRELLAERGLAPGLSRVTLNDAIERSGIPRSSAYRLYSGGPGPLESFRIALLESVSDDHLSREMSWDRVEELTTSFEDDLESGDAVRMASALREIIRTGVAATFSNWVDSTGFYVVASTIIAASSPGADAQADLDLMRTGVEGLVSRIIPTYRGIANAAGLRLRQPMTWDQFGRIVAAGVDGVAMRNVVDPSLSSIERPTGPNGEMQEWSAAAMLVESLVRSHFEADPNRVTAADLNSW
ncbi:MAG: hypothetical protein AAF567_17175 [Actinomycetota bacterium]